MIIKFISQQYNTNKPAYDINVPINNNDRRILSTNILHYTIQYCPKSELNDNHEDLPSSIYLFIPM